jgi:tryptophanyl-tRNA synthetase
MNKAVILTGITTTGTPHLGNYVALSNQPLRRARTQMSRPFIFWLTIMR